MISDWENIAADRLKTIKKLQKELRALRAERNHLKAVAVELESTLDGIVVGLESWLNRKTLWLEIDDEFQALLKEKGIEYEPQ